MKATAQQRQVIYCIFAAMALIVLAQVPIGLPDVLRLVSAVLGVVLMITATVLWTRAK